MAKSCLGKFKTPTMRNLDRRSRADFVKAYMHNGYLNSLREVVYFCNTANALPMCKPGDPGEKVTCWPAPENPETINRKQLGDLKLPGKQALPGQSLRARDFSYGDFAAAASGVLPFPESA
jgi:cytochrome c peroxidase